MAVGWAREGDTEKETENRIALEVYRARKSLELSEGEPRTECVDCDKPIPAARLKIFPRTQRCTTCQSFVE
jgi:phage/conjugal plasmid C-4 type zinc finger TraR family protein